VSRVESPRTRYRDSGAVIPHGFSHALGYPAHIQAYGAEINRGATHGTERVESQQGTATGSVRNRVSSRSLGDIDDASGQPCSCSQPTPRNGHHGHINQGTTPEGAVMSITGRRFRRVKGSSGVDRLVCASTRLVCAGAVASERSSRSGPGRSRYGWSGGRAPVTGQQRGLASQGHQSAQAVALTGRQRREGNAGKATPGS
jgi:hypothetical protein